MSYQKYWSLSKLAFGRPETADEFFSGRPQREALARIDYLIRGGHSNGLMIAPPGVGQTTLLRRVAESAGFGDTAVDVVRTGAKNRSREELLHQLAIRLGTAGRIADGFRQVSERITASGRQRVRTVWLIDDCTPTAAETAASLSTQCPWMTAIAGCTAEQALRIAAALGGCSLRIDLEPFDLSDTVAFISHQIAAAGGRQNMFTDGAMVRLHELGEGRVATIATLAELTLPVAASEGLERVTVDLIESVQHEVISAAA